MHTLCTIALVLFAVVCVAIWLRSRAGALQTAAEAQGRAHELKRAYLRLEAAHHRLKTAQHQLVQSEKLASLGQLTAGIAHELKNPLNFVNNFADLTAELVDELYAELDALSDLTVREARTRLADLLADLRLGAERIGEHGHRADGIIRSMMQHANHRPGERTWTHVNDLVEEYLTHACHGRQAQESGWDVTVERDYDQSLAPVHAVPCEIGHVLLNLLSNAFYAVEARAKAGEAGYVPTVRLGTRQHEGWVEVAVADNGAGMTAETRQQAFQPFFSTKPAGEGPGLGLSISHDIVVKGHGGSLTIDSEVGAGTAVRLRLPTAQHCYEMPIDSTSAILQRAQRVTMPALHAATPEA